MSIDKETRGASSAREPQPTTKESNSDVTQRPMTFGEKLVGLTFNPSNDSKVDNAKRLCAALADLVNDHHNNGSEHTELQPQLYNHTIGEILNAQMNVVKVLTLKY